MLHKVTLSWALGLGEEGMETLEDALDGGAPSGHRQFLPDMFEPIDKITSSTPCSAQ